MFDYDKMIMNLYPRKCSGFSWEILPCQTLSEWFQQHRLLIPWLPTIAKIKIKKFTEHSSGITGFF